MDQLDLFAHASPYSKRVAIVDDRGSHKYAELLTRSAAAAAAIAQWTPGAGVQPRVAYLVSPGFDHVVTQWGIWRAGAIGVPLSSAQAPAEWSYVVADAQAALVIVEPELVEAMRGAIATPVRIATTEFQASAGDGAVKEPARHDGALILYTSGTTGRPKGVLLTHANVEAQVRCLVASWEWRFDDRVLHVLPLNHVHGIVNVLTCALWAGATCEMLPRFDVEAVWNVIVTGRLTLFMAVPTIYAKLIAAWEAASPERQRAMSNGCRAMRLMVSGSAALPVRMLERWREISGHVLLERYGMTEIGMALSNPLKGERRPGAVGVPLPGVLVRIVDERGEEVEAGTSGELEVQGPGVFKQYWQRPDATEAAFREGWFRTGDIAVFEDGMYRLLGRQSVDIIKSGGYKISALEIEEVVREHPDVAECAVVGIEDEEWGERVAVAIVPRGNARVEIDPLRDWARPHLARYKLPAELLVVSDLPRNAMGKVAKPAVKDLFKTARSRTAHTR